MEIDHIIDKVIFFFLTNIVPKLDNFFSLEDLFLGSCRSSISSMKKQCFISYPLNALFLLHS